MNEEENPTQEDYRIYFEYSDLESKLDTLIHSNASVFEREPLLKAMEDIVNKYLIAKVRIHEWNRNYHK